MPWVTTKPRPETKFTFNRPRMELIIVRAAIQKNQAALLRWGLVILGLGVVTALSAMAVERLELRIRLEPGYWTMRFVTR